MSKKRKENEEESASIKDWIISILIAVGIAIVIKMFFFDFVVTPRIVVQRPKKGVIISIIADNFFIVNAVPKRDDAVDDLPEFIGIELLFPSQKLGVV